MTGNHEILRMPMRRRDLDHLLTSACAYALGRGTYADTVTLDMTERNRASLSPAGIHALHDRLVADRRLASADIRWRLLAQSLATIPGREGDATILEADPLSRRILFACAFRHDIHLDDPTLPDLWRNWWDRYATVLRMDGWRLNSARDLVWAGLVPLGEPLGQVQGIDGRIGPDDDRWVPLFRLMRDGTTHRRQS